MPAYKHRHRPEMAPQTVMPEAPVQHTERRRLFVFGAGVDLIYNIPIMSTLLREMAAFAKNDGQPIHNALKKKLPRLQFNFEKYAGDQSEGMLKQLFSSDNKDLVDILRTAANQLQGDDETASVAPVLERLCALAENNQLTGEQAMRAARFAGSGADVSGDEAVLDPDHVVLRPTVAQALRRAFVLAVQTEGFSEAQRSRVEYFIEAVSNVEELMSLYFMLFSLGSPREQKKYLYIVWMLWAFLRLRSFNPPIREASIYQKLPLLGGDIVTFNYTNFFDSRTAEARVFLSWSPDRLPPARQSRAHYGERCVPGCDNGRGDSRAHRQPAARRYNRHPA